MGLELILRWTEGNESNEGNESEKNEESNYAEWILTGGGDTRSFIERWPETIRQNVVCIRSSDAETAALRARNLEGTVGNESPISPCWHEETDEFCAFRDR